MLVLDFFVDSYYGCWGDLVKHKVGGVKLGRLIKANHNSLIYG